MSIPKKTAALPRNVPLPFLAGELDVGGGEHHQKRRAGRHHDVQRDVDDDEADAKGFRHRGVSAVEQIEQIVDDGEQDEVDDAREDVVFSLEGQEDFFQHLTSSP
ncbi:MAG: hypothetical protein MZW92_12720 [Comamonadaceae bacterium]|nr:hypothetical protein [Comamonadaceae bacterium]